MSWRMSTVMFVFSCGLVLIFSSCKRTPEIPPGVHKARSTQIVSASFYDKAQAGGHTASGEVFDPNDLTAAHPSYPFGTVLNVTNPKSGRSVRVRVNDRGPIAEGRSLDLSRRAAREIGIEQDGVSLVEIEVLQLGAADGK